MSGGECGMDWAMPAFVVVLLLVYLLLVALVIFEDAISDRIRGGGK